MAGMSFRFARSPEAPKMTMAQGGAEGTWVRLSCRARQFARGIVIRRGWGKCNAGRKGRWSCHEIHEWARVGASYACSFVSFVAHSLFVTKKKHGLERPCFGGFRLVQA